MPYVTVAIGAIAFAIALGTRKRRTNPPPVAVTSIAYALALGLNLWFALKLPFPRVSTWITGFSGPMAKAIEKFLLG